MNKVKIETKVYVWSTTDSNPGHASLEFDDTYISYWPTKENSDFKDGIKNPPNKGNLKDFKLGFTHNATYSSSYKVDRRLERKDADYVISLDGLDVNLMKAQWKKFKDHGDRYNMQKRNCSTVVASFLEIGSKVPYQKTPCIKINHFIKDPFARFVYKLRYMGQSITMWTPDDVRIYALQIKSQIGKS